MNRKQKVVVVAFGLAGLLCTAARAEEAVERDIRDQEIGRAHV